MIRKKNTHKGRHSYAMLMDAHGNRITMGPFKIMLAIALVISLAALGLAGFVYYGDHQRRLSTQALQTKLSEMERQLTMVSDDLVMLSAQLAVTKPEALPLPPVTAPQPVPEKVPNPLTDVTKTPTVSTLTDNQASAEVSVTQTPSQEDDETATQTPQVVPGIAAVEKFKISPRNGRLQVQFKIVNRRPREGRIAGYLFCAIKGSEISPEKWILLPGGTLKEGFPAKPSRGYGFEIRNFRTIRMKTAVVKAIDDYNQAHVWVFSKAGSLLFSRSYPFN